MRAPRTRFWTEFIARANARGQLPDRFGLKEPYYLNFPASISGALWGYQRHRGGTQINLHFWVKDDREGTLRLYRRVECHKQEIEAALGEKLRWEINPAGANVALDVTRRPIDAEAADPAVLDALLDAMERFQRVLEPWLHRRTD
jgi:hypothetical protein